MFFPEYAGISYERASREGLRLIRAAAETGRWHGIVDRLAALRDVMRRRVADHKDEPSLVPPGTPTLVRETVEETALFVGRDSVRRGDDPDQVAGDIVARLRPDLGRPEDRLPIACRLADRIRPQFMWGSEPAQMLGHDRGAA